MIKIGILIGKFEELQNWELRIIKKIISEKDYELKLLIQDGRIKKSTSIKDKFLSSIFSKYFLLKVLNKIQFSIEKHLFRHADTVNKKEIINYLKQTELIKLKPNRKGFLDIFSKEDSKNIKGFDLDIILRHEFNIIRGDILSSSKYGIWSFHHADNDVIRGGPPGFWEIILKKSNIGITLQELTPELDGGLVIDKAFTNISYSYIKNRHQILEDSVSLLFKSLKKIKNKEYEPIKSKTYSNILYKAPDLFITLKYIINFYKIYFATLIRKIESRVFSKRFNRWSLFIGKGNFLESTLFKLKPVKVPKDEFWADPFLFSYEDEYYVFFENYSYVNKKGKISCGKVQKNKIVDVIDVLNLDYHLSYPFIFKEGNEIFMMPESSENKRLEIYRCINFPNKWELYSTAFEGEIICDAHFFNDEKNQKWLFLNKSTQTSSVDLELFIYKVDSIKLNEIISHKQNPVLIDSRTARNAGEIFKYNNEIFRPSQFNGEGIYGRGLNVNRILKLTQEEYVEENILRVMPNFHKDLVGVHHLHQKENIFIIDGCFR